MIKQLDTTIARPAASQMTTELSRPLTQFKPSARLHARGDCIAHILNIELQHAGIPSGRCPSHLYMSSLVSNPKLDTHGLKATHNLHIVHRCTPFYCYMWSEGQEVISLSQHKDWKRGETGSTAPFKGRSITTQLDGLAWNKKTRNLIWSNSNRDGAKWRFDLI